MKTISIISISLLIVFAASCKSSKSEDQAPKTSTAPIVILDAVRNQDQTELSLTFKEQKEYDPNLLEIRTSFYKKSNNSFSLINEKPSSKWITKEMGHLDSEPLQLIFTDFKDVSKLTVNLVYDSKQLESKTFDFDK